jgi:hypothetical protein
VYSDPYLLDLEILMVPDDWEKFIEALNNTTAAMAVAVLALFVALSVIWKK